MNALAAFSPEEITAIRLSLRVAFWAMTASLPVGILVALLLARGRFWESRCSTASSICR
jgi:molybdate transport system permease protein